MYNPEMPISSLLVPNISLALFSKEEVIFHIHTKLFENY
jgi:hypothetical protein